MTDTAPDPISDVLDALYGGLLQDQPWVGFLQALSGWLGATYATLILTAPGLAMPGALLTPGADPDVSDDYLASFFTTDPFQGLPEGQVTAFAEFVRDSDDPALVAYRGFLAQAGGDQVFTGDDPQAAGTGHALQQAQHHGHIAQRVGHDQQHDEGRKQVVLHGSPPAHQGAFAEQAFDQVHGQFGRLVAHIERRVQLDHIE